MSSATVDDSIVNGSMPSGGIIWSAEYRLGSKPPKKVARRCPQPSKPAIESAKEPSEASSVDPDCWPSGATSVMLKNIPVRYTQEDLLDELGRKGFDEAFDYFHLVMDMRSKRNKGFAFLNMCTPALAKRLHTQFHNSHLRYYSSKKVVEVVLAKIQGLQANIIGYLNAHGDRVQNVWFRPIIFTRNPWKAVPLKEENLPKDLTGVYRAFVSKGTAQTRHRKEQELTKTTVPMPSAYEKESGMESDNADKEELLLQDGEYDEIRSQVWKFQNEEGEGACCKKRIDDAPQAVPEAILTILEKPRRKRNARKSVQLGCSPTVSNQSLSRFENTTTKHCHNVVVWHSSPLHVSTSLQELSRAINPGNARLHAPWIHAAMPATDSSHNLGYYGCDSPLPIGENMTNSDNQLHARCAPPKLLSSSPQYVQLPAKELTQQGFGFPACSARAHSGSLLATSTEEHGLFSQAWPSFRPPPGLSL